MAGKRLGMFGGAFDPPHKAHAALIEQAVAQLQLDELRVFPTGNAWHKTRTLSPAADRLAMAELAFASLPHVVVDGRETRRTGPSYTIDTLLELRAENPGAGLFLVIGGDQARALPTWHRWQEIMQIAIICVAERGDPAGTSGLFDTPDVQDTHAITPFEARLTTQFVQLKMPPSDISASSIRARIASHQDVVPLVAQPVARYIVHHHLYQTA